MEDIDVTISVAEQPTTNRQPPKNIRDPDSATPRKLFSVLFFTGHVAEIFYSTRELWNIVIRGW